MGFAKNKGFETVHFHGMLDDIEVYTAGYNIPRVIGLPQVILTDGKTVKLDSSDDPFKILDACKKRPKLVFEYDCISFFGSSYGIQLLDDGRLIRFNIYPTQEPDDCTLDEEIINSPELVKEIKGLIKENKEELTSISRDISNPHILDGAGETFRFGRMKFEGSNILTVSMEGYEEDLKKYNAVEMGWEKELLQFQRVFKKFQKKFHEFVEEPLFNGEEQEEEE